MAAYSVDANGNRVGGKDQNMNVIPPYSNNIPVLAAGAEKKIWKAITCNFMGKHEIQGVINTESLQPREELNIQNNQYRRQFTIYAPPPHADLVLYRIQRTTGNAIKIKIYNRKAKIPWPDFNVAYVAVIVDNNPRKIIKLKDIDRTGTLRKGGGNPLFRVVNYVWPKTGPQGIALTPGQSCNVVVHVDYANNVHEKNISNNRKERTL